MIYVSSSCVKNQYIWESVEEIALNGFQNIELSGGTERDPKILDKLLSLKQKYSLNYRCHNYFPPPNDHFVMNLASDSDEIYKKTASVIQESIELSKNLDSKEYGFHAGFLTDITTSEIGKSVQGRELFNRDDALNRFSERVKKISKTYENHINLYIENNVCSKNNYANFDNTNCFLLTSYKDVKELKKKLTFNFLLDIAHLYVSANTLGNDFNEEFLLLSELSDYIHISDNNGISDQNKRLYRGSDIYNALLNTDIKNKTFTLEINNDVDGLIESYALLETLI